MGLKRILKFKMFKSATKYWDTMFAEAAEFASVVGEMDVQNITTACDHGTAVVTVWFWSE